MSAWREIVVAAPGTHHERDGRELSRERYDSVLSFHEPGLAAVRRDGVAWHIDVEGNAAYRERFRQAFGFYDGLAAVEGADGWVHIRANGASAYEQRFAWCGNFGGDRCPVRDVENRYFHIEPSGAAAYRERWKYVGDFRSRVACVQRADGLSTHIDATGGPVHGVWFDDLDVFHKGFARARDARGWMHIDATGRPRYERRFAAVEPFYNGQARVERFDGGFEVIDEDGATRVVPRGARR